MPGAGDADRDRERDRAIPGLVQARYRRRGPRGARYSEEVRQFEVNLIRTALGRTSGSQIRAAKLLGLKPTTLNAKIKRYNITPTYQPQA